MVVCRCLCGNANSAEPDVLKGTRLLNYKYVPVNAKYKNGAPVCSGLVCNSSVNLLTVTRTVFCVILVVVFERVCNVGRFL